MIHCFRVTTCAASNTYVAAKGAFKSHDTNYSKDSESLLGLSYQPVKSYAGFNNSFAEEIFLNCKGYKGLILLCLNSCVAIYCIQRSPKGIAQVPKSKQ